MSAVILVVTAAGRAALVNAAAAGTNAVTIAQAGLTSLAFTASASMTALPGEFRRITTVAGAAVDPDTIHLVIRDESAASYDLTGFGLYLSDGTLFALYGQADPILEKSPQSTALVAVDVRFADINAASLEFSGDGFLNPPATTSVAGVVELATNAEAAAGADAIRAVTPAGLKAAIDGRFGANAASSFVRTLLDRASAAAFRERLELRSAALKDEGAGGGLDADLLDGLQPHNLPSQSAGGSWPSIPIINNSGATDIGRHLDFHAAAGNPGDSTIRLGLDALGQLTINGSRIWHTGNDGAGSGLDADLLDGQDGSFYTNIPARLGYQPVNRAGDVILGSLTVNASNTSGGGLILSDDGDMVDLNDGFLSLRFTSGVRIYSGNKGGAPVIAFGSDGQAFSLGSRFWHAGNDGAGSGLDADLLDGRDANSFANASHSHGAADIVGAFADRQLLNDGWQLLPGGLLLQWGRVRQYIPGEGTIQIWFPRAFAAEPFSVQLTGVNSVASNNRDTLPQLVSAGAGGALVYIQMPDSGGQRPLDGFDWFAIGLVGEGPGGASAGGGNPGGGDPGGGGGSGGGGEVQP